MYTLGSLGVQMARFCEGVLAFGLERSFKCYQESY